MSKTILLRRLKRSILGVESIVGVHMCGLNGKIVQWREKEKWIEYNGGLVSNSKLFLSNFIK